MKLALTLLALMVFAVPAFAQTDTPPPPTPTPIIIPDAEMYESLQEADDALGDLTNPLNAPEGDVIVPDEDGSMIFSYAKWLMSDTAAAELFGPFEGIATHMGVYFAMRFALMAVYGVLFLAVYLIKWVVWIFKLLMIIVQAVGSVIDLLGGVLGQGLGWLIKFIGG